MAIVSVDPPDPTDVSLVQVDSSAGNFWLAIAEINAWAADHGFIRTSEFQLRQVMIGGRVRFRGICYRPTTEEADAAEHAHRAMIARADQLPARAAVPARGEP